jgi:hypothetical protein
MSLEEFLKFVEEFWIESGWTREELNEGRQHV